MKCSWCEEEGAVETVTTCQWNHDTGNVTINEVPSIHCPNCQMTYQTEEIIQKIEERLTISDLSDFGKTFTFEQLQQAPVSKELDLFGMKK